ncbi:MAG: phosphate ABC transporter permease PstA [Vulcanibacillus sp.]
MNDEKHNKSYYSKRDKSLETKNYSRKIKDGISYGIIGLATAFTIGILVLIIGFIFIKGAPELSFDFLSSEYDSKTNYVNVETTNGTENRLGIILQNEVIQGVSYLSISKIEDNSKIEEATNSLGDIYKIKTGDIIKKIGDVNLEGLSVEEANSLINNQLEESIQIKVTREGGGVLTMIITTLYIIGLTLIIAIPIGIFAAIYLVEYAKPGKLVNLIRFATESLAGIPSIIFGLFGMIVFVVTLDFGYSILSGTLTLSIILLPVIVRQTEESLKAVPMSYREASYGLGANKLYTIRKVVVPSATPGIVVAVILSIGRIIGESAALYLTAGTIARIPDGIFEGGATLTIKAYMLAKEEGDIATACAIGVVIILIILFLNGMSKLITRRYSKIN